MNSQTEFSTANSGTNVPPQPLGAGASWADKRTDLWGRFERTSLSVKMALATGFLAVVVVILMLVNSSLSGKEYRVLFSNVSGADGAAIVTALEQMNVPYQFTEGGGAIMVPKSVVYETRLKLAGQGLPKSGNVGFELLENQKFGTSQFVERVNYLRGLEGELSRSIASMAQVKAARVHLAVPKQTAFVREQERPSASVLITLHPGRTLDPVQTAAIARLVSSSVPGMSAKEVSILDTDGGSLLTDAQRAADMDATQLRLTKDVEQSLSKRIADILEPLAGKNGFRAQVTVDMSFDERERTAETFARNSPPNEQSIRSEKTIESRSGSTGPGGIPGSLTNQPQDPPEAPVVERVADGNRPRNLVAPGPVETGVVTSEDGANRQERTVNYEVDRAIERFKSGKGQIRRVSAAVVLDYKPALNGSATDRTPFSPEELTQISALIRDAIGYVQVRGDTVSVANLPFSSMEVAVDPGFLKSEWMPEILKYLAYAMAVAFVYFAVLRPLMKARTQPVRKEPVLQPEISAKERLDREIRDQEDAWAMQRDAWQAQERLKEKTAQLEAEREQDYEIGQKKRYDELVSYAEKYAEEQAQQTALQLRAWLVDSGAELAKSSSAVQNRYASAVETR